MEFWQCEAFRLASEQVKKEADKVQIKGPIVFWECDAFKLAAKMVKENPGYVSLPIQRIW